MPIIQEKIDLKRELQMSLLAPYLLLEELDRRSA